MNKYILKAILCAAATLILSVSAYAADTEAITTIPETTIVAQTNVQTSIETTVPDVAETTVATEETTIASEEATTVPEEVVIPASPEITSIKNIYGGIEIKWEKRKDAECFIVFRKTKGTDWVEVKTVKENSYVDKQVENGKKYSYTVRCADISGNNLSTQIAGASITYVKTPVIKKITNTKSTAEISWSEVKGVFKYKLYYLNSKNKWKKLATTSKTAYTHKKLTDGKTYTYKVKGLDKKGNIITGEKERTNLFLKPVHLKKVSKSKNGVKLEWNKVSGVSGYSVYRKQFGGKWKKIADVKNVKSFIDTKASADKVYAYTIRCLNSNGKAISYYNDDVKYYKNGKLTNEAITVGKDMYNFNKGVVIGRLVTDGRYKYYYGKDGKLQKNGIVGSKDTGYWYADKKGKINTNYVNAYTKDKVKWIIRNGKALVVKTKSHEVMYRAAYHVSKATDISMTKSEKLYACFRYVQNTFSEHSPRVPHYTKEDWPIIYADDMFVDDGGNCCSYAAAFGYMAAAIGYDTVYCCNSGGHGWTEIDGKIYDPEWGRHYKNYTYFGLSYDEIKSPNYKNAIAKHLPWMYVKIEY